MTTIYFSSTNPCYISPGWFTPLQYTIGGSSISIPVQITSYPIYLYNTDTSQTAYISIYTNVTLNDISNYFIIMTDNIAFSADNNIVYIDNVLSYPGLIQNGTSSSNGYNNIIIQNVGVVPTSNSTLDSSQGWICQNYFATSALNNVITNCYSISSTTSTSTISPGSGGIVGSYAASIGGNLEIINCFSNGEIQQEAGGIVGNNASYNGGSITINNCYSIGDITGSSIGGAGGIVGSFAENVNILNCYSVGNIIGSNSGGIIGLYYANNSTNVNISNCYTIGNISSSCGGIAANIYGTGSCTINNCYTTGSCAITNTGLVSDPTNIGSIITVNNSYSENGNGWNDSHSYFYLVGVNSGIWTPISINTNYLLSSFNSTLYNNTPYTNSSSYTIQTNPGLIQYPDPNFKYIIYNNPSPSNISIDPLTGIITFQNTLPTGTYNINVVCCIDPPQIYYNYTIGSFTFIQNYNPPPIPPSPVPKPNISICFPAGTLVLTDQGETAIEKINTEKNTIRGQEIVAIIESVPLDSYLICIEKNALGNNIPNKKTIITKDHKVLCDKKMVRAEYLIQYLPGVYKVQYNKQSLYNILLKEHSTMSVNNLYVETMNPSHILAKIYTSNYTNEQKSRMINALNKYNIQQRKKLFIRNNIFRS